MIRLPYGRVAFVVTVLLGAYPLQTARAFEEPVARGPAREPVPYRYEAKQWQQVPRTFLEDGPVCMLYAGTSYLIEADGTEETISHEIIRLNNRRGVELLGQYHKIIYDPSFQKLTLNEARLLKTDGRS